MAAKSEFDGWVQFRTPKRCPQCRLICFPFAGGGASQYAAWKSLMGDSIEVVPVQLPGRENRINEDFVTDAEVLTESLFKGLEPLLRDIPFFLFGHSMGGMLAYKFEQTIEDRMGLQAEKVFVSATSLDEDISEAGISSLPEDEFIEEVNRYGGLEKELWDYPEYLDLYIRILRQDFKLIESYSINRSRRIEAPVHVYYGTEDRMAGSTQARSWEKYTLSEFSMMEFAGGHFFIKDRKEELCRDLKRRIEMHLR